MARHFLRKRRHRPKHASNASSEAEPARCTSIADHSSCPMLNDSGCSRSPVPPGKVGRQTPSRHRIRRSLPANEATTEPESDKGYHPSMPSYSCKSSWDRDHARLQFIAPGCAKRPGGRTKDDQSCSAAVSLPDHSLAIESRSFPRIHANSSSTQAECPQHPSEVPETVISPPIPIEYTHERITAQAHKEDRHSLQFWRVPDVIVGCRFGYSVSLTKLLAAAELCQPSSS
jgi:hypothetical protein